MQATIKGIIEEGQKMEVGQSAAESAQDFEVEELDDEADDFMETYLAINLDLKVRES